MYELLTVGTHLKDKYEIVDVIGTSERKAVYLAQDVTNPEEEQLIIWEALGRFEATRKPPGIKEYFRQEDKEYLVLDIGGQDLALVLQAAGCLTEKWAIKWGADLCEAIGHWHERKPYQVIYLQYTHCDLADFKLNDEGQAMPPTLTGGQKQEIDPGRPYVLPVPETVPEEIDARSDVYALGATLYYTLTGQKPALPEGSGKERVLPPPVRKVKRGLRSKTERIVSRAMRPDPEKRYATAAEMAKELREVQAEIEGQERPREKATPSSPFGLLLIVGVVILGLIVAGAGAFLAFKLFRPVEIAEATPTTVPAGDYLLPTYFTEKEGLISNNVFAVAIDLDGSKWFGTDKGVSHLILPQARSSPHVYALAMNLEGGRLLRPGYRQEEPEPGYEWEHYTTRNSGLTDNFVQDIAVDKVGTVWFATQVGGLSRLKPKDDWTTYNQATTGQSSLAFSFMAVAVERTGHVWVGSKGGGAIKLGLDGSITVFDMDNSGLPYGYVRAVAIDGEGNKWFGTMGAGAAKMAPDESSWYIYDAANSGLSHNNVNAIATGPDGEMWLGTEGGGLCRLEADSVTWTNYKGEEAQPFSQVTSLAADKRGHMWLGTNGQGVVKLDNNGSWLTFSTGTGQLLSDNVRDLAIDPAGDVWIATDHGVVRLTIPEKALAYTPEPPPLEATPIPDWDKARIVINQVDPSRFPQMVAYASVLDLEDNPILDLEKENFSVRQDDRYVPDFEVSMVGGGDALAVAVIIDISGSMKGDPLAKAKAAASDFVNRLAPQDQVCLFKFDHVINLVSDFTTDKAAVASAIGGLYARGDTALYDVIYQAVQHVAAQPGRKAIVLLTDGEDTASKNHTLDESLAAAKQVNVPIFAIGLQSEGFMPEILERSAQETGGQYLFAPSPEELAALYMKIGGQLQNQYRLDFESLHAADHNEHLLTVTVTDGTSIVADKKAYISP